MCQHSNGSCFFLNDEKYIINSIPDLLPRERETLDDTYGRINDVLAQKAPSAANSLKTTDRSQIYEETEINLPTKVRK